MRNYEAMLLFSPTLDEDAHEVAVTKFTDLIKNNQGKIEKVDQWGKRKLAYEIAGHGDGNYVVIDFEGENKTINELDRILRITDDIMRYIIVKLDA